MPRFTVVAVERVRIETTYPDVEAESDGAAMAKVVSGELRYDSYKILEDRKIFEGIVSVDLDENVVPSVSEPDNTAKAHREGLMLFYGYEIKTDRGYYVRAMENQEDRDREFASALEGHQEDNERVFSAVTVTVEADDEDEATDAIRAGNVREQENKTPIVYASLINAIARICDVAPTELDNVAIEFTGDESIGFRVEGRFWSLTLSQTD